MDFGRRLESVVLAGLLHLLLLLLPVIVVSDAQRFITNPRGALFLLLLVGWCLAEGITHPVRDSPARPTLGPRWLPALGGASLYFTFVISLSETAALAVVPIGVGVIAGALAMLLGLGLRLSSIRALGRLFVDHVALLPSHVLVRDGLYGWVRHPSEAGTLFLTFGGVLLLGSPLGLVLAVTMVLPATLWRVRLEDMLLAKRYPAEFPVYANEVWSLLPTPRRLWSSGTWDRLMRLMDRGEPAQNDHLVLEERACWQEPRRAELLPWAR
jgi:protein-S-isoprenylcysteine O-methyltransferase Ste14